MPSFEKDRPGAEIDPNDTASFADFRQHHGRLLDYVYASGGARLSRPVRGSLRDGEHLRA